MSRKLLTGLLLWLISLGQVCTIQRRLHLEDAIFWNGLQGTIADFINGVSLWCLMLVMPVVDHGVSGAYPEPALLENIGYPAQLQVFLQEVLDYLLLVPGGKLTLHTLEHPAKGRRRD